MKTADMDQPRNATRKQALAARLELLRLEKACTRQRDHLAQLRRNLPWIRVERDYTFDSPQGRVALPDLFAGHSQLVIQHFMLGPGWEEGCKSCSFMLDHFVPAIVHLAARDVAFAVVSRAPLAEILPFKQRMGWDVNWVSSHGTDFNRDFHVSFTAEEIARGGVDYNYGKLDFPKTEAPGVSVFARDKAGTVHHTYSTYGRGVEFIMGTYHILDLVPKGRNEESLDYGMSWVRHHDRYEPAASQA